MPNNGWSMEATRVAFDRGKDLAFKVNMQLAIAALKEDNDHASISLGCSSMTAAAFLIVPHLQTLTQMKVGQQRVDDFLVTYLQTLSEIIKEDTDIQYQISVVRKD